MTHELDGILAFARAARRTGRRAALATVVRTWGSSPRPAGSKLAVDEAGEFVGSVSGGCIEAAVIAEAREVMAGAPARRVTYGVSDETAWSVGLACGGKVEIWIEEIGPRGIALELVDDLLAVRAAKRPVALATWLDGSDRRLVEATATDALATTVADAVRTDRTLVIETPRGDVLVEPHNPPLRLIVVGAVHIADPLVRMAELAGFAVTIVDPRRAWATPARFPDRELVIAWPDVALAELDPDARTAIATLSHDPKIDDPALIAALASPAFYIGCLGSKTTHAARLERLRAAGCTGLERLHGPIGLPIGGRAPAEIAVSIVAQIVATLRGAATAR